MRWLVVLPFEQPGFLGSDFVEELTALGHETRIFAYRRQNALYKNRGIKELYQRWLLRRLERLAETWRPDVMMVIKGGPIAPEVLDRVRRRLGTRIINVFPDNPLWMMPFPAIEVYDIFFTKERYALRCLQQAGLRNLYYLPSHCVPAHHFPVTLTADERERFGASLSFVGSRYPYRERFVRELAGYPLRLWGSGWTCARDPEIRRLVAGPAVYDRDKLCVYSGSTLSLNQHHPMNDIVGVNNRTFELAATAACQVVDLKEDLATLFKPGEEIVAYRDLGELRRQIDYYLAHPDEARAIGVNARARALAEHTARHRIQEVMAVMEQRWGRG